MESHKLTPCLLFLVVVAGFAVAEQPTQSIILDSMRKEYEEKSAAIRKPLTDLGGQYRAVLVKLQEDLQKNADLDGLIAVKEELARFDKEFAPAPEVSGLESISRFQKIYEADYDKKLIAIEEPLREAKSAYRKKLEKMMVNLTKFGEVELAVKVRTELEQLGPPDLGDDATFETDLVFFCDFDEVEKDTVRDVSGTGNHGKLKGDAKVLSLSGNRGKHAVLDGRGDYIEIQHHKTLSLTSNGTISIWVKPKRMSEMGGLISKYNKDNCWTFRNWSGADRRKVSIGDHFHNQRSKSELKLDRWTHLVATFDENSVNVYMNGKLDSKGKRPKPIATNDNSVRIGSCYGGRYFNGSVDDVRVYQRALSAKEVAELFQIES